MLRIPQTFHFVLNWNFAKTACDKSFVCFMGVELYVDCCVTDATDKENHPSET